MTSGGNSFNYFRGNQLTKLVQSINLVDAPAGAPAVVRDKICTRKHRAYQSIVQVSCASRLVMKRFLYRFLDRVSRVLHCRYCIACLVCVSMYCAWQR